MGINRVPSNSFKPEAPTDLVEQGFRERDAVMMLRAILKLTDERQLRDNVALLGTGLPEQRAVELASGEGEALRDAADYDLLRLGDLCRGLQGKPVAQVRFELEQFLKKELERRTGLSPQA